MKLKAQTTRMKCSLDSLPTLKKSMNWKGATFVISGAYNAGDNLSNKIGNFFTASESSVTDGAIFYELYLAQTFNLAWDDTMKIRLGRMSMSDTFASLPVFGYIVSGGLDSTPEAIFSNSPFTSSPIATWGMIAQYNFEKQDISLIQEALLLITKVHDFSQVAGFALF